MIDKLNDLIDLNLTFLLTEHKFSSHHLLNLDKKSFRKYDHLQLANLMAERGLVTINGQNCTLTEEGLLIAKNGSWLAHLDNETKTKSEQQTKADKKVQLESKIAELTEINLTLQNKQLRTKMLFSIIGFILGIIATNWKEILTVLKIISPPETK
ncbi:MAG: hypothetical protein K0M50_21175 [Prolixibacteraceae bacterium]|nr:hypothetical protein [Prolixibacteraceae bacterium]